MELHQLRYVLAVVDSGSFTAAASALHISQSGVSTQVRKLESELGIAILQRTTRRVMLTSEGELVLPVLRAAVEGVDAVAAAADDLRGLITGTLRVGTVSGLTWRPVFDAIARLHHDHPGVEISVREGISTALIEEVESGELDVAIAAWSGDAPQHLPSGVIVDDALHAVIARNHPWATRSTVSPDEIADIDLISLTRGTGARAALDALLARQGQMRRPRWEVASPSLARMLATRGLGVAALSASTAASWNDIVSLPISDPDARSRLGVVWRDPESPAAAALLSEIGPHFRSAAPSPSRELTPLKTGKSAAADGLRGGHHGDRRQRRSDQRQ
ncbi:LysR family transcriptional regulator [Gordonia otitidis]|uniref:LysR family transcriptional regulator n=2 Tax=Gordonia otitidis TaxID=249058 RepID=UPI001D15332A|nr:LysR family transcriptional regulator [Gordonia otitidis]UEA59574.1 LysR family transcriptional regulator [Gordonia otitidis]